MHSLAHRVELALSGAGDVLGMVDGGRGQLSSKEPFEPRLARQLG
jgi:hypothetical protein